MSMGNYSSSMEAGKAGCWDGDNRGAPGVRLLSYSYDRSASSSPPS
jgi:hypothetical protein